MLEENDLIKKTVGVVLIFIGLFGGVVWSYLDYMKQKQMVTDVIRAAEEQSRNATKAGFESQLRAEENRKLHAVMQADLAQCQQAAEQAKSDYLTLNQKPMPRKPGEFTVTRSVLDEAEKKLLTDRAECLKNFETRLMRGS
jgi:hypothetical protein